MGGYLGNWLAVRAGERRLVLLMGANYYLLLVFYYLLKPARDSLFLVGLNPKHLPLAYIMTALIAAPVTAAYARAGMKHRLDRLIMMTTVVLVVGLLGFHWLIPVGRGWVIYLFYSWVGVAGGLTTSQFWLQANGVFDATQAKRIFAVLGLGGIAGAFTGGEITGFLVRQFGLSTEDLLLVAAGVLVLAGCLAGLVWRHKNTSGEIAPETTAVAESGGNRVSSIIASILNSRHLSLTVGIIALTVMMASFVDFQFKTVTWQAFPMEADLTAFLGRFYGRMSLVSLLVQLVLAPRLIRWFGVGNSLLVLPIVLAGGTLAMLLVPGLAAGMVLRGSDFSLKYSLDRTSRELLFLPIPMALKKRTKVFIDMFVDRWARGVAGGLLLLLTAVLHLDLRGVALVSLLLVGLWLVLALLMRRAYLDSFRSALSRQEIDLRDMRIRLDDTATVSVLIRALGSGRTRDVIYALDLLRGQTTENLGPALRPLLAHESSEVRRRAVALLAVNRAEGDTELVGALLADPDLATRTAAVAFVVEGAADEAEERELLAPLLTGAGLARNGAVAYLGLPETATGLRALATRDVIEAILRCGEHEGCEGREVVAGLPWLPDGCGPDLWDSLLRDPDPKVVQAVMEGFGSRGERSRVPWLLVQLGRREYRIAARESLAAMARVSPAVIVDLERFLTDRSHPSRERIEIPRLLAGVPHQNSVEVLIRRLDTRSPHMRYAVLKALGKLRVGYPRLVFDRSVISEQVCTEAGRYIQLARVDALLPAGEDRAKLLNRAIGESQQLRLESVFRLLGLLYPAKDLLNAYHGIMSGQRVVRANAQEFLDNLLAGRHRRLVLALLEDQPAREAWRESLLGMGEEFDQPLRTAADALAFLGSHCDPWLAACAMFAGGKADNAAAEVYLTRTGDEMLSPIEKVLLLQNVEVFAEVPSDQLAALAAISSEVSCLAGDVIYREHDSPDGLYIVLSGSVRLSQGERTVSVAAPGVSFGTWALFDDQARVLAATAMADSRLLRIGRGDFNDLLSDDVRIAQGIIRTVAGKLRELAERAV